MAHVQVPYVLLNSGHKMPMVGFGAGIIPPPPKYEMISILLDAIEVGYRHFDTAREYYTEEALGEAIAVALHRGLIKSRHEVFITTKLWCTDAHPELVLPALQDSLKRLSMSNVDLYLIHAPVRFKPDADIFKDFSTSDVLTFDIEGTWRALESCCQLGLAKSIGVSNFGWKKISQILEIATIPPSVNQVEMNVNWQQTKLVEFCKKKGIHVTAYSPLGANGTVYGSDGIMQNTIIKSIATTKQKTVAQVALRWIHEQGVTVIPRSFNKERMKQNLQISDWKLTNEEMAQIHQIPQKRSFSADIFVHPDGQYKSVAEFWDEEG